MLDKIKAVFESKGITRVGFVNIKECDIINQRLLPYWAKTVVMFCIPYRTDSHKASDGISEYARVYDYHNFSKMLYLEISDALTSIADFRFQGFCDHSPINEKLAAAKCGLGVIGKNSIFIDNIYGSYVFLGSLITDIFIDVKSSPITHCINCGLCSNACPGKAITDIGINTSKCLSGISQKKHKSDEEKKLLKEHNIVWGCDICQEVCPYNINNNYTPISYFAEMRASHIDSDFICALSDEEFNKYAFAYKGRKLILDNIEFK